jgi:hypothetical protein
MIGLDTWKWDDAGRGTGELEIRLVKHAAGDGCDVQWVTWPIRRRSRASSLCYGSPCRYSRPTSHCSGPCPSRKVETVKYERRFTGRGTYGMSDLQRCCFRRFCRDGRYLLRRMCSSAPIESTSRDALKAEAGRARRGAKVGMRHRGTWKITGHATRLSRSAGARLFCLGHPPTTRRTPDPAPAWL